MTIKEQSVNLFNKFFELQEKIEWGNKEQNQEAIEVYDKNKESYDYYYKELAKQCCYKHIEIIIDVLCKNTTPVIFKVQRDLLLEVKKEIENI